ncbi:DAD family-domain-containing protein [Dichotomocladium elegans]|nr:DAD family-domain-containing protein [Dichotomocladium elegans]
MRPKTRNVSTQDGGGSKGGKTSKGMPIPEAAVTSSIRKNNAAFAKTVSALRVFWTSYTHETPKSLKLIDIYLAYIMLTGVLQFLYMVIAGTFPYNAFLGGFISTVGSFVLAANLRIQTNEKNASQFASVSPERAFGDFAVASLLLHFFCFHFLG